MNRRSVIRLSALVVALVGCGRSETGLVVSLRMGALEYDELRLGVSRVEAAGVSGATLVDPATKGRYAGPFRPGDQSVVVYLADDVAGTVVRCAATALRAGAVVGSGTVDAAIERGKLAPVDIIMTAGGAPPPSGAAAKANGEPCSIGTECLSTQCVDGVCCESDCQLACRSCALPETKGLCRPVAAGTADPRGQCSDEGAATCQTNGLCGVSGDCALYPAGTTCAPAECTDMDKAMVPARTCDGAGMCGAAEKKVKCDDPTRCVAGICS